MKRGAQESFFELAKNRKTTYEFSDKKVPDELLQKILETGRWAPSHGNTQPWSFIVVKNKDKIRQLMGICIYGSYHTAPNAIIAVAHKSLQSFFDKTMDRDLDRIIEEDKPLNIGMPAITMAYEATELGVDTCFLSPTIRKAREILGEPDCDDPIILLGLGYERENAVKRTKKRNPLETMVRNID